MCIFSSIHEYWLRGYDILTFAMNRVKHFTTKDWYMIRVISNPIDIQVLEDLNQYVTNCPIVYQGDPSNFKVTRL